MNYLGKPNLMLSCILNLLDKIDVIGLYYLMKVHVRGIMIKFYLQKYPAYGNIPIPDLSVSS